jgi:hypothetical protein
MLAMDVNASIFCARDSWRGSVSMASTVALRAASCCINSGFCAGHTKPTSMPPSRSRATSCGVGGRTLKTMSERPQIAAASGTTCAPAAP